ncbi:MAG: acylphosphatase [Candidatus Omnitrophica bacterium]|nr:acylphosphatase [Candidatus Omnitrophota bacterium]
MSSEQRIHVLYSGRVQGVGFRFTAERIASSLGLTGYVKNLPDGSVEAVCEGPKPRLDDFLEEISERMGGYISSSDVQWQSPRGEFASFEVKVW